MRIWNKSAAGGELAHPFEVVEPGLERRVCECKTTEWRWRDAGAPADKDKCRGGLLLERDEALALAERRGITLEMQATLQDQHAEGVESLREEIGRLRGAILAALDNLENGPEGALTAEGALRLALNPG